MRAPTPRRRWDDGGDFLPVVLGLVSLGRRLDRAIESLPPGAGDARLDRVTLAVLGVTALWRRFEDGWLHEVASRAGDRIPAASTPGGRR